MIGRIRGILIEKHPLNVLVEVGGVSYDIQISTNTFYQLPKVNTEIILHTHLVVREEAQVLYGFYERDERTLFRELIKVSSIGARTALAILSSMVPSAFVVCITNQDVQTLTCIPGIGQKTAERLILETKDRLKKIQFENVVDDSNVALLKSEQNNPVVEDAIDALVTLGYRSQEAKRAVSHAYVAELSREDLIRQALKNMVRKS